MSVLLSLHILVLFSLRRYCLRFCLFSSFIIHAVITLFKFHYVTSGINEIRHHVFLSVELCHLRSCCLLSLSFLDIVSSISTLFGARYRFCFLSFFQSRFSHLRDLFSIHILDLCFVSTSQLRPQSKSTCKISAKSVRYHGRPLLKSYRVWVLNFSAMTLTVKFGFFLLYFKPEAQF